MTPSSIVFFVLFIASTFNIQCDSFSTQTHISRVAVKSFSAISRSNHMTMTSTESVSDQVQLGRVTMYKKEGCPYCKLATDLLVEKYGMSITFVDIETPEKRDDILQQMRTFSGGRNTVPQIFFNSDHIGGNDDLQKLELDGKLNDKVATVRKNAVSYMQDNWFHPWY